MGNLSANAIGVVSTGLLLVVLSAWPGPELGAQANRPSIRPHIEPHDGGVAPAEIPEAFRSGFHRAPGEETPVPDVLVLRNGQKIETYFLRAYATRLVFYVKENARSYTRREIPRSMVASVLYGQYLERDPTEPRLIRIGTKQPVPKRNILAGKFRGAQDHYTTWTAVFHSETNKPLPYAEDATEYGTFVMESHRAMPGGYSNRRWNMGRYSLFAPNTVNNEDWVLELTEVTHSERDRTDHVSWLSGSIQDDVLIVEFLPGGGFRLRWSNLSSGAWTTLPQVEFQPVGRSGRGSGGGSLYPRESIRRSLRSGAPVRLVSGPPGPSAPTTRPARAAPESPAPTSFAWKNPVRDWVLGLQDGSQTSRSEELRRKFLALREKKPGERVEGWGPPNSLWDR